MPASRFSLSSSYEALLTWLPSALLLPACAYWLATEGQWWPLDAFNLIVHEAGHFFFRWFGDWVHFAGGSLLQLLLPGVFVWHFLVHGQRLGVQLSLAWLGQSALGVARYAADAQERALPLLGGEAVYHDWHQLLGRLGLLHWDDAVGAAFTALAVVAFALALAAPLRMP